MQDSADNRAIIVFTIFSNKAINEVFLKLSEILIRIIDFKVRLC